MPAPHPVAPNGNGPDAETESPKPEVGGSREGWARNGQVIFECFGLDARVLGVYTLLPRRKRNVLLRCGGREGRAAARTTEYKTA